MVLYLARLFIRGGVYEGLLLGGVAVLPWVLGGGYAMGSTHLSFIRTPSSRRRLLFNKDLGFKIIQR